MGGRPRSWRCGRRSRRPAARAARGVRRRGGADAHFHLCSAARSAGQLAGTLIHAYRVRGGEGVAAEAETKAEAAVKELHRFERLCAESRDALGAGGGELESLSTGRAEYAHGPLDFRGAVERVRFVSSAAISGAPAFRPLIGPLAGVVLVQWWSVIAVLWIALWWVILPWRWWRRRIAAKD